MKMKIFKKLLNCISVNSSEAYEFSDENNAKTLHYISGYADAVTDIIEIIEKEECKK